MMVAGTVKPLCRSRRKRGQGQAGSQSSMVELRWQGQAALSRHCRGGQATQHGTPQEEKSPQLPAARGGTAHPGGIDGLCLLVSLCHLLLHRLLVALHTSKMAGTREPSGEGKCCSGQAKRGRQAGKQADNTAKQQ
jgi:hypothetical protein